MGLGSPKERDGKMLRRLFGHFASGVTVLLSGEMDNPHGMTANSFVSISLEPPLILISVATKARMAQVLKESDWFSINILAEGQETLSQHFSGRTQNGFAPAFEACGGRPVLRDAVAHVVCRPFQRLPVGDHILFIGEVEDFGSREASPLLFYRGQYCRIGGMMLA